MKLSSKATMDLEKATKALASVGMKIEAVPSLLYASFLVDRFAVSMGRLEFSVQEALEACTDPDEAMSAQAYDLEQASKHLED